MKNFDYIFLTLIFFSGCWATKPFVKFNLVPPLSNIHISLFHHKVYYFDQTVAGVLENPDNKIVKCEIVDAGTPEELTNILGKIPDSYEIKNSNFSEIRRVINQCELLDVAKGENKDEKDNIADIIDIFKGNPFNLLTGIVPDTKWCGPGNIAENYQDLGNNFNLDSCCRFHDLCPTKIMSKEKRYNIINNADYTVSHCDCDAAFYKCLKNINTTKANIIGNIYFNVIKMQCIEDSSNIPYSFPETNINHRKLVSTQKPF